MKNFDWEIFGRKEIAVWCKTEEEARDFCKQSHEHGFDWEFGNNRASETYFGNYENTCYLVGTYGSKSFCENDGYTIVEWSDYMCKPFTKSDLRDGDFVLRRNGQVEIVISSFGTSVNERGFSYLDEDNNSFDPYLDEWDIMEIRRPLKPNDCQFCIFECKWGELLYKREDPEEMTLEEVCKALGKTIEIVDKKEN